MRIVQGNIDPADVQAFLKSRHSGLGFTFLAHEYTIFRVLLDTADIHKLILWWEHKVHTDGKSQKVTDAARTAREHPRIKRIIEGAPTKSWMPLNIRKNPNFELVLESNSRESNFLNIVDGNHRAIAQHLTDQDFQDVPAFLCIHPKIGRWT